VPAEGHALQRALAISSSASSHWPMVRMQWCTRPGPRRACASAKPSPSAPSRWAAGTRTFAEHQLAVAVDGQVVHHRHVAHDLHAGRVHRHQQHAVAALVRARRAASDTPMTMASRHCGCSAPVMNHLRPLIT
jgi:hypothetical protein